MSRQYPVTERPYNADLEARIDAAYARPAVAPGSRRSRAWEQWVPEYADASDARLQAALKHLNGQLHGGYHEFNAYSRQSDERTTCLAKVRAITHILDQRRIAANGRQGAA